MNIFKSFSLVLIISFCSIHGFSQNTSSENAFNNHWKFHLGGLEFAETADFKDSLWENVHIPHTWNAKDPFDDDLTYTRGIAWYRKSFQIKEEDTVKKIILHFEGVFQVADVYINGAFSGRHKGGYTAFEFDITKYLKAGENMVAVKVNNAQDQFIPPLSIGYASYGGIYRPISLIFKNKIHFSGDTFASSGIKINTPEVSASAALIKIETRIFNGSDKNQKVNIVHQVFDRKHQLVKTIQKDVTLTGNQVSTINLEASMKNPELWSPEQPNLYTVESYIEISNKKMDEAKNSLGLRWFSFSANNGFSLNGRKYILRGTNRHQDMQNKGDALTIEDHQRDFQMIKDMGCNFVRLAHYPQAHVLNLADSLGLFIWEETPIVNYMNINPEFLANSEHMIKEMIHQGYNHPSVIIWGSMNEILLWSSGGERIQNHDNEKDYVRQVQKYAVKLDSVVRKEDPSRYNVIAMHMSKEYDEFNISDIPKISAFNVYSGWYSGKLEEFGSSLDKKHQEHPKQILFISEYGAGVDNRINTSSPERLDFSGQYQRLYHESYIRQTRKRAYLSGTAIWNQFDFSQPNTGGTIPHLNQKGLVNWDRTPKDSYFLFKANWNPKPMIYIASRDWKQRSGKIGQKSPVEIYSNLKEVSLELNGKKYSTQRPNDVKKINYTLPLKEGKNLIKVRGFDQDNNLISDTLSINFKPEFIKSNNFNNLYINVGSKAQYLDAENNIWAEDRPYKKGSFGFEGGENILISLKKVILSTENVPVYYSSLEGLTSYIIDLPAGQYTIKLGFVEPKSLTKGERIFDVSANGKVVIENLDITAEAGEAKALQKSFSVIVHNNGLKLNFKAKKGKTILSNLSVEIK